MKEYGGRWFYDVGALIARARGDDGEPEPNLACALLQYFCHCVEDNRIPDARVMHYLSVSFGEFLKQGPKGDIEKALGLKRRRAGNPGATAGRHKPTRLTTGAAEELRQDIRQRLLRQETHSKIKKDLSVAFGTSQDTVRNLIREIERAN